MIICVSTQHSDTFNIIDTRTMDVRQAVKVNADALPLERLCIAGMAFAPDGSQLVIGT